MTTNLNRYDESPLNFRHYSLDSIEKHLTTPVALIVFNRPETTAQVSAAIRQAQTSQLLIIADGARLDCSGEAEKCQQVRHICDRIDWQCEVKRNYAESNLGCKRRISSGLDWVFSEVEEAIILEDDCLPHPDFFRFCQELIEKYRSDRRVMSISGDNYLCGKNRAEYSYYFSIYSDTWGWATWRRAWQHNDIDMKSSQEDRSPHLDFRSKPSCKPLQLFTLHFDKTQYSEGESVTDYTAIALK